MRRMTLLVAVAVVASAVPGKEVTMRLLRRLVAGVGVLVASLIVVSSAFATTGLLTVTSDTTLTEDHYAPARRSANTLGERGRLS